MLKKTLHDVVERLIAFVLLILFLPLMLLIAVVLYWELKSFPFFAQERALTLSNKKFKMIKFRTMKIAPQSAYLIGDKSAFLKPELNSYVPKFSGWLRRKGLDELPQLINVLLGQMSIVGPRPFMMKDLELLKAENELLYTKRSKLNCKPGITGLWQIAGDRTKGLQNLVELDQFYSKNKSFSIDIIISLLTAVFLFFGFYPDAVSEKPSSKSSKYQSSYFIRSKILERILYIYAK